MKKATLASFIAVVMSGSVVSAEFYNIDGTTLNVGGRAEARFNVSDNNKAAGDDSFKDLSRARVYLQGKTRFAADAYGFGKYEAQFSGKSDLENRYFFAGVGASWGEFSYGKQDSAQVMLTDITDVMATFGASADGVMLKGDQDRLENNFLYSGTFNQLAVKANYIAEGTNAPESYGIAALYNFGMFDLGAGYIGEDKQDQFNLVGQLRSNDFTFGALVQSVSADDDMDILGYELSAHYQATAKWSVVAVYNYAEVDSDDVVDELALETVYKFNNHLQSYAGYKLQLIDNIDDEVQVGIRYDF